MTLAIIAGKGDLPKMIIKKCQEQSRKFFLVLIEGESSNEDYLQYDHQIIHIGHIGKVFKKLREKEVKEIVFVGGISKPSMANMKVDTKGALLLSKITASKLFGDDNVLTSVTNFFEKEGFKFIGVDEIIDDILVTKGVLGKIKPKKESVKDIQIGKDVLQATSKFDIGQAIAVQQKHIVGIEAVEGTDALIKRCADLKFEKGHKPVLIKIKKEGQNSKVDLPAFGVDTIDNLYKSGFCGIAVEADSSLIINKKEVIRLAEKYGLFIIGV